jgi:serine/threonine protein kinase
MFSMSNSPSSKPKISKIARYEILRELGRGGMAVVYLAHDPNFQREVAIKVLPREAMHDSTLYQRFQREARTIASLDHPAIVPVYDFGEEDGQPFLVMRYLSGGSLAARIKQGPLPVSEAAKVLLRIGGALDAAHAKGIVHRDLKPANILFDQHGDAYLSDFGIAQLSEATSPLTGSAILGTPAYMSPEQIRGEGKVDGRADIYALGIVLFEMLTGKTPFTAATPAQVMMMHLANPTPRLPEGRTGLPKEINSVLVRALAKDPELRIPKASELGNLLSAMIADEKPGSSEALALSAYLENTSETNRYGESKSRGKTGEGFGIGDGEKPSRKIPRIWIGAGAAVAAILCFCILGGSVAGYMISNNSKKNMASPSSETTDTLAPSRTMSIPPTLNQTESSLYAITFRTLNAVDIWRPSETDPEFLQSPRGIAIASDGSVYVTDTGSHQIFHFDSEGKFLKKWGRFSGPDAGKAPKGSFNEPWGIAVGRDGSVFVADTWNFRIQKFSAEGTFLTSWGFQTQRGYDYSLYGPRALATDFGGRLFVADTGNKRIVVYDSAGNYLKEIGGPGFEPGLFNEPVGLAFGPDYRLFVADNWNKRIQVFQEINGEFEHRMEWPFLGWEDQSKDFKPYLAVSSDGRVWVTDPGNDRILVFTSTGDFLFAFGVFGSDSSSFSAPTGIAINHERIYITDTNNHRIMIFAIPE